MDVIKFVVDYSREKSKYEKKILDHSLVTDSMTYMNEENADWIMDNNVLICAVWTGPRRSTTSIVLGRREATPTRTSLSGSSTSTAATAIWVVTRSSGASTPS